MLEKCTLIRALLRGGLGLMAAALVACAPAGDSASLNNDGSVAISLTDNPGDFAQYTVTVSDLTLTHANGAVVHTIAQPVAVDFAQYVQMSEFLATLPVPNGRYTQASMTLDYTKAHIQVENGAGKPVTMTAAQIVDKNGNELSSLTVDVQLDGPSALTIAPGLLHHLHLDFDLAATNKVTLDSANVPTLVTVEPLLIAEVNPQQLKEHRVRGLLENVDVANQSFTLEMRPFMAALAKIKHIKRDRDDKKLFGDITVVTNNKTTFNINDTDVVNADGLVELAKLAHPARVVVKGLPKFNPFRFEASAVVAVTVEQNLVHDVIEGTVIKRVGDDLTVRGEAEDHDGDMFLGHDFTVKLGNSTTVTAWHKNIAATKADISVGQHLHVAGTLDATHQTLNATKVHMQATWVAGTQVSYVAPILTLKLARIDGVNIAAFDFTGANKSTSAAVTGAAYTINMGNLVISSGAAGAPLRVTGMPVAFGVADTYAFNALVAVELQNTPVTEEIQWKTAATNNIGVSADHTTLTTIVTADDKFSLTQSGIAIATPATAPAIIAAMTAPVIFSLQQPGNTAIYHDFAAFMTDLTARLTDGGKVQSVRAIGSYDASNQKLSAQSLRVVLAAAPKITK
ncbi:MAG: DUF4382 domain-containing protein [Pseudomonadota bacterium]